ncbi:MAG: cysteine--tRNA ligase [Candidatus Omnitrophota bacterium]|jgi:cysteinyl-tRNA synthetase
MPLRIYNSLSRVNEEFLPLNPPKVNIYTCGVTVYDSCHIGHARSLYIFNLIRKYLLYRGYKVNFVRNITDIDDKIINKARESGRTWKDVAEKYIEEYRRDLELLHIEEADSEPRATENIECMIAHIAALVEKGAAYASGGDVYFNVRKFPGYGKLSGQDTEQMRQGVRIGPSEMKVDPLDFALWKSSKPSEPSWASPWGAGRPGWHIECSAMSMKYLGSETLDIHAGGRDLIFPHHENEIAQSEALTGKPFARYWIHHGLLTINGQKMSKSLGNFITIRDAVSEYPPDVLKLLYLQTHYSSPLDFSREKMKEAAHALERINIFFSHSVFSSGGQAGDGITAELEKSRQCFLQAMDNDFNTPEALACVFSLISLANKHPEGGAFRSAAAAEAGLMLDILGLSLDAGAAGTAELNDGEITGFLDRREEARRNKDYALSDKIRKELESRGIILEDTKQGTLWRRKI